MIPRSIFLSLFFILLLSTVHAETLNISFTGVGNVGINYSTSGNREIAKDTYDFDFTKIVSRTLGSTGMIENGDHDVFLFISANTSTQNKHNMTMNGTSLNISAHNTQGGSSLNTGSYFLIKLNDTYIMQNDSFISLTMSRNNGVLESGGDGIVLVSDDGSMMVLNTITAMTVDPALERTRTIFSSFWSAVQQTNDNKRSNLWTFISAEANNNWGGVTSGIKYKNTIQYANMSDETYQDNFNFSYIGYMVTSNDRFEVSIDNIEITNVVSGSNELPTFNVTFKNNTYCLDPETGTALVEFNISANDNEGDTIYYSTTAGYSGGEAYIYDFDNYEYENITISLISESAFFITCVIQSGDLGECSVFSRTGILPDLNELQDNSNLQTNCPIAENTWNATENNKSIRLDYDSTKGYMLQIDSDKCSAGTGEYVVINDKRAEERDFTSYFYIEPEINSSLIAYYTYFIHNPGMDKVNITRDDTNIYVYSGSSLILNTTNTSLYLKFDMRIDSALYDIFIYDTDFTSDTLTLLTTSGNHSITDTVISFLQIEPYKGTFNIDDILFTDYLDPVTYSTVKPTSESYPYAGTFSITFYVTDEFKLTDYSNFQTFEYSINGFCVDSIDPNKKPTTVRERGTLSGLIYVLRAIFSISSVFDSFPIIKSVGSIFYILIFLLFLFRGNFDFIGALGKSSIIVFIYSLMGLTYTFVGLTSLIMLIIVIVLKVRGSSNA